MHGRMNGWMNGWMDKEINGGMDVCFDGWKDR